MFQQENWNIHAVSVVDCKQMIKMDEEEHACWIQLRHNCEAQCQQELTDLQILVRYTRLMNYTLRGQVR